MTLLRENKIVQNQFYFSDEKAKYTAFVLMSYLAKRDPQNPLLKVLVNPSAERTFAKINIFHCCFFRHINYSYYNLRQIK